MSNLMRLPHEISLWEDVLTVVDNDGNEYSGFVDISKIQVAAQYYKEKKLCVISSDKIESPTHVVDPALARKTDGTSTLTFSIYAKYWDEESGELVDNPFIQYLTNERKVKLKYFPNGELKWLDLVIKKIDESSENYKFTYTATDLFINELSKSGYNLEFDMELENNQGPVNELASKVLAGTDWVVGADSELLQQTTTEALYEIVLTKGIKAKDVFTEEEKPIPAKEKIYAFYSTVTNKTYDYFQFIYNENGIYTADENGILYNAGNYYAVLSEGDLPYDTCTYKNDYRGERYVRSPKTVYDETIGRYVNVYNNGTRYGYSDDKYISPALVNNLITNGSHIISNTGWFQQEIAEVKTEMLPTYKEVTYYEDRIFGLEFVKNANNTFIVNSGFKDNVSKIGSIAKNDKFIFRVKGGLPVTVNNITTSLDMGNSRFEVEVAAYRINEDSGAIEKISGTTLFSGQATLKDSDGYYYTNEMSANRAVSQEELTDVLSQRYGIFITTTGNNGTYYIQEVELFASVKDKNGHIILPNGNLLSGNQILSSTPVAYVDTTYYYYDPNSEVNKKATEPTQMEYEYVGKRALESYIPTYVANFEKIRGITAKETNRFNLLQSLSETFECWCRFDVLHKENGEIALGRDVAQTILSSEGLGSNGIFYTAGTPTSYEALSIVANSIETVPDQYKQQKFVTFHKRVGQQKSVGFTYGINLKSVSRSLDSNDIATKLIVKNNSNKYADIGSCSIARANVNPSGENFILDFSHYVRQGLMNYTNIQNDLYSTDSDRGWIGLYTRLKNLNNSRDILVAKQSPLVAGLSKHKSDYESSSLLYDSANKEFSEQIRYYHSLTGWNYGEIENKLEEIKNDTTPKAEETRKNLQGWLDDKKVIATVTNIERLREEQKKHKAVCDKAKASLDEIEENINNIEGQLDNIKAQKTELLSKFEKKYGRFLQEASWISDDHTDDNLYYFDAETTLHNSAQPKVSYTVNIVELSQLEGYEGYNFELGDITYVQDTDFFGWTYENGFKTPYKEEIVITEMTTYFNSPEKNVLKAKNYRDQFEDLFQRMAASSQQLQFHSGAYDRAADAVSSDGNIMPQALSDAFANNAYVLSNIANQSVKWDEYGITTTDTTNPADIVRITSGGIYLTEDGGRNWTTGISASGINAKTITTGQLDTGAVTIMSGDQTAFRWDDSGINAFKEVQDGEGGYQRSSQTYVRFDEHGLYGIDGQANFDPKEVGVNGNTGIDRINDEAKFALTWDGFVLNSGKSDPTSRIKISDKEDFQLYRTVTNFVTDSEGNFVTDSDGNLITRTDEQEAVRIGRLGNNNSVGMQVNASKTDTTRPVIIGDTGMVDGEHGKLVFRAGGGLGEADDNAPFRVYEDGFFYAKNAQIGGTLTAAQLRDISISLSYSGEVDGNSILLTCSPTIAKDELDGIVWKIDDVSIASEATVRLDYDRIKEIYEGKEIPNSGVIKLTVAALVSGDGDVDDSNGESREGEIDVDITSIFKTETAYAIGESGTVHPAEGEWGTELPAFEPGKYCWMRVSNIFVVGDPQTRYEVTYFGKDGADAHDLNLKASSLVFIKDKAGNISPEEIYFEAVLQNYIGEGSFNWVGANAQNDGDSISNTAILTKDDFGDSKVRTVSVDYGDLHDEVTIALLDDGKDGESAITVILSNPAMTFDVNIADQEEETQVYVYFGTTEIKDFTLTPDDSGVDVDGSKIKVRNPGYSTTKQVLLSATINGKTYEQIIPIKCLVTDTGYRVELTNDSASIGVDSDGNPAEGSLGLVSSTSVEVYFGSQDITGGCEFEWSAGGGTLQYEGKNGPRDNCFTKLTEDSATATVTATYGGKTIGEKTFTITKVYAGAAVSFKLNTSFTSVNSKQTPKVVTLQVLKIIGSQADDITDELGQTFEIKADNVVLSSKFHPISQTTTFTLEIGETIWDTETVAVVHDGGNGEKGDKGDEGDTVAHVYAYYKTNSKNFTNKPSTTNPFSNGWSKTEIPDSDLSTSTPYVYRSEGIETTSGSSVSYTNWQTPELYKAHNSVSVNYKNYAEYLKITNFGASGLYYNGGQLYVNADHIKVTSDGSGNTGDVVFEAAGSSKTVFIAGWTASNNALYTSNNTLYLGTTGITANIGETSRSNLVFKAGSNFGVDSSGALYAASGSIGGFTIGQINLTGTKRQSFYYNLVATSSGNDIISSSMVICPQGLYRSTEFLGQTGKYWKMIVGTNFGVDSTGTLHAKAANISGNLVNTAIVNDKEQTVKIKEGYLECNQVFGVTNATRMVTSIGDMYSRNGEASDFYVSYSNTLGVFVIGHEIGTQIQFTCVKSNGVIGSSAKLIGSWFTQAGNAVTSDRTKKNNIADIDEPYGLLFDNLVPVTYKYNDGTSGRTHTGFIAQDVCLAIEQAGLSTSEFAGYVVATMPNLETGEEETTGYLRYEEFISLNTWQIQKLKPRMTAAEQEIESLKLEIEQLRAELNSIK